ncbi:MAG: SPOR domain-containing protein [Spiribacter sp.]|jgi:cell division protein FtsN|nr:SPOR domain-containing protein [Spiribacter sp.]MDR9488780.1 SPOR domain-containing protein [Spiribacter sp.]
MATKTRGKQASRDGKSGKSTQHPLLWAGAGLAVGLLIALMVHLEHTRPDEPNTGTPEAASATSGEDQAPRFEFYRLLTEQEVEVAEQAETQVENSGALPSADTNEPATESTQTATQQTDTSASPALSGTRYLLQAGSFRRATDADSLKANLALLGIEARIQVVELPGGETWHRVRIGPFASLQDVNSVRSRMAAEQIDSILLRAGG